MRAAFNAALIFLATYALPLTRGRGRGEGRKYLSIYLRYGFAVPKHFGVISTK